MRAFRDPRYCTGPDLDHSWIGSHHEGNFLHPNDMLKRSRNRGFVKVNEMTEQPNQLTDHDTMGYYTDVDLPFYYDLVKTPPARRGYDAFRRRQACGVRNRGSP